MFGSTHHHIHIEEAIKNDSVLEAYHNCTAWIHATHDVPENLEQGNLFKTGQEMKNVAENIRKRLGLTRDLDASEL